VGDFLSVAKTYDFLWLRGVRYENQYLETYLAHYLDTNAHTLRGFGANCVLSVPALESFEPQLLESLQVHVDHEDQWRAISLLPRLRELALSDTRARSARCGLRHLRGHQALETLSIKAERVDGAVRGLCGFLPKLRRLKLASECIQTFYVRGYLHALLAANSGLLGVQVTDQDDVVQMQLERSTTCY
jgi:hypothetical protein